jgi:hypothetical protein
VSAMAVQTQTKKERFNFERFFTLFKGNEASVEPETVHPENSKEQALEKQAQVFLDSDMIDLFVKMTSNGYSPNAKQVELFENKLIAKINTNSTYDVVWLEDLVNLGYTLSPKIYTHLMMNEDFQSNWQYFCDYKFFISPHGSHARLSAENKLKNPIPDIEPSKTPNLIEQMTELSAKREYYQPLFDTWLNRFRNMRSQCEPEVKKHKDNNHWLLKQSFRGVTGGLHMRGVLFRHLNMAEYIALSQEISTVGCQTIFPNVSDKATDVTSRNMQTINSSWPANILPFYHIMQEEFKTIYADDIEGILTQTKSVFIENYLTKQAAQESLNLAKDYSISQLPQAEQELLNQIKEQYAMLLPHYKSMNEEDKHNLNHLVVDKMPGIINRYLSMNEEYRQTMVNSQGKNAQELLHESLSNIEQHLQKITVNINELNLKELSVSARYTGQKNKM